MELIQRQNSLSVRQQQILNSLIKEYIDIAEPVSSDLLKKRVNLGISPATIRNDLQELTELGYVMQPHTSAGRVPTEKGYKYFVEITFSQRQIPDFKNEIGQAKEKIEKELQLARELTKSLTEISSTLSYTKISRLQSNRGSSIKSGQDEKDTIFEILKIIGPSQATYQTNIDIMKRLLKEFENF